MFIIARMLKLFSLYEHFRISLVLRDSRSGLYKYKTVSDWTLLKQSTSLMASLVKRDGRFSATFFEAMP